MLYKRLAPGGAKARTRNVSPLLIGHRPLRGKLRDHTKLAEPRHICGIDQDQMRHACRRSRGGLPLIAASNASSDNRVPRSP